MSRVAIRGWSFGGYLAALAVMRRPDVFMAAVAGAPVTDWQLYDTHYTERYLGHPSTDPANYEQTSLLAMAPSLDRPLMLIHGLADDNVVAATRFSSVGRCCITAAPRGAALAGVSHMTPQRKWQRTCCCCRSSSSEEACLDPVYIVSVVAQIPTSEMAATDT